MIFGSVASGIEGASCAWHALGWQCAFVSEIEKFPCKVLSHHYPDVPNRGDMTRFEEWPDATIDVLVGGTPCQSFSVAGLRGGLDDARGNLMLTFAAIARRYRPRWLVWENVPGVLSSNQGLDFGSLLGLLSGRHVEVPPGGWKNSGVVPGYEHAYGLAWRVLDAQYFGVPQRRRRVFVVGCLGDWRGAAAVLLEQEGLSWNPPPSRKAKQEIAASLTSGSANGGRAHGARSGSAKDGTLIPEIVGALSDGAKNGAGLNGQDAYTGRIFPAAFGGNNTQGELKVATACRAKGGSGHGDFESETFLVERPCIAFSCKDSGHDATHELAPTLRSMNEQDGNANAGGQVAIAFTQNQRDEVRELEVAGALPAEPGMKQSTYLAFESRFARNGRGAPGDLVPPLKAESGTTGKGDGSPLVAFNVYPSSGQGAALEASPTDVSNALSAVQNGKSTDRGTRVVQAGVRRLTPRECERLQGFPDDWTAIPGAKDGPRYKALGNAFAVPVLRWIGERIEAVTQALAGG